MLNRLVTAGKRTCGTKELSTYKQSEVKTEYRHKRHARGDKYFVLMQTTFFGSGFLSGICLDFVTSEAGNGGLQVFRLLHQSIKPIEDGCSE